MITPLFHNFFSAKMFPSKCFCQEQVDAGMSVIYSRDAGTLDRNSLADLQGGKKIMKQLPFRIQIMTATHFDWYDECVYEKFQVVGINEEAQTFVVITYDGYGRPWQEEVSIADCKILD